MKSIKTIWIILLAVCLFAGCTASTSSAEKANNNKEIIITAIIDDIDLSTGYGKGFRPITILKFRLTEDSKPEKWILRGIPLDTRVVLGEKYQIKIIIRKNSHSQFWGNGHFIVSITECQ